MTMRVGEPGIGGSSGAPLPLLASPGLVPDLDCYTMCSRGWNHYLASLTGFVEGGSGSPYGSEEWERGRAARVG